MHSKFCSVMGADLACLSVLKRETGVPKKHLLTHDAEMWRRGVRTRVNNRGVGPNKSKLCRTLKLCSQPFSKRACGQGMRVYGTHLRAHALKTEIFSEKSVVLEKRKNGFTKTLFSFFAWAFCLVAQRRISCFKGKGS